MKPSVPRLAGLAGVLICTFLLASAFAAAGPGGKRPFPVAVGTEGKFVGASQGSYCISGPNSGACADYAYPLAIRERLIVKPGARLVVRTGDPAIESLHVQLLRAGSHRIRFIRDVAEVHRSKQHPSRWLVDLPEHLGKRANVLDLFALYRRDIGDANFWAGIQVQPTEAADG